MTECIKIGAYVFTTNRVDLHIVLKHDAKWSDLAFAFSARSLDKEHRLAILPPWLSPHCRLLG